jgi:hypothetical protein
MVFLLGWSKALMPAVSAHGLQSIEQQKKPHLLSVNAALKPFELLLPASLLCRNSCVSLTASRVALAF